jgi:hypothetical protein
MHSDPVGLPSEEQRCPRCPPDDDIWPPEAFSDWHRITQGQSKPKEPICNACLFATYPRTYRSCLTCGAAMHRRSKKSGRTGYEPGRCHRCRAEAGIVCQTCFAPAADLSMVGEECLACWLKGEGAEAEPISAEHAR